MITEERTWSTKLIAKLLVNNVQAFSINNGFVNAFSGDINRPDLDHHIFMVYKSTADIRVYDTIVDIFKENKYFHSRYTYRINHEFYQVFVLVRDVGEYKRDIQELIDCNYHLVDYDTKITLVIKNNFHIRSREHKLLFDHEVIQEPKIDILSEVIPEIDPPAEQRFRMELAMEDLI